MGCVFFFQAEDGIRDIGVTGVQTCTLPILASSEYPRGQWFSRPGPVYAAADEVRVRVVGTGGHGSAPHRARDPIPAACEMVVALQTMTTRGFDVFDPVVVTVGRIAGGTKDNIIPDTAEFDATVRS